MSTPAFTPQQASARARELYELRIRNEVEPDHVGEYLVMNLDTGDYVVGPDRGAVSEKAAAKFAGSVRFGIRVGAWVVARVGGRLSQSSQ